MKMNKNQQSPSTSPGYFGEVKNQTLKSMNKILVLSTALCMITLKAWSQSPIFNIDPGNKYIYYPEITGDPDFKAVSQLRIGPYLTIGNLGLSNHSWIGSNVILDYSSYGQDGSAGDKNLFVPAWADGTGLIMDFNFASGSIYGRTHRWDGSSARYDLNNFDLAWMLGANRSYFAGNLGIGTQNTSGYKLAVNGSIKAKEVNVTLDGWADFVFAPGYALPPLREVEEFIQEEGHLPGIPSTPQVLEEGVDLGEMNALLLQKVEELTLYVIALKKEIDVLKERDTSKTEN